MKEERSSPDHSEVSWQVRWVEADNTAYQEPCALWPVAGQRAISTREPVRAAGHLLHRKHLGLCPPADPMTTPPSCQTVNCTRLVSTVSPPHQAEYKNQRAGEGA